MNRGRRLRSTVRRNPRTAAAIAAFAATPALALGIALWPCHCPAHRGAPQVASVAMAQMPGMSHASSASASAGATRAATQAGSTARATSASMWTVGTERAPLVTRGAPGPLWRATRSSAPGSTAHGTFAAQYVARQLAKQRAAGIRDPEERLRVELGLPAVATAARATDPVAERTALTTAQATKKLSKRCQTLVKAKHPSRLSKSNRKRRTACLKQRAKLIADSKTTTTAGGTTAPTPTPAPSSGPTPTPAPGSGGTGATPTPTPTPTPSTSPCAGKNPCYAAVGVKAIDSDVPFALTRGTVMADIVSFQLQNTDSQQHNLYWAPADANGNVSGALHQIFDLTDAHSTTANAEATFAPGRYKLICTVSGHAPMMVDFIVSAPLR